MARALFFAISALAGLGAGTAQAASTAKLVSEARLIDGAARIDILSAMVLPSVDISSMRASRPAPPITTSLTTSNPRRSTDNASLRIQGQAGETVSMAVPESFQVIRNGGTRALTVRTLMRGGYSLGDGVLLGSALTPQTLSVNVAGVLAPQGLEFLEPGAYEGVLALVVQYN